MRYLRIAVLDSDRCQPRKCSMQCIRFCPGVRMGDETIVLGEKGKPIISEQLCTGCGICIKKCPYEAITIVNLPDELEEEKLHQFGVNGFRLFRLPYPREKAVTALLGENGIGKSTVVRVLSGELIPNLGTQAAEEDVLERFSGTQFYDFFEALYRGGLKAVAKPQYVDGLPKVVQGSVEEVLSRADERGRLKELVRELELEYTLQRDIATLSGGELQRVAIAAALLREAELYIFDEPSSYLDVRQRLRVARLIRRLAEKRRILVVEHDLLVMDYLADYVNPIYGTPGAFGIVALPRTTRHGINAHLQGYLREENVRFRRGRVKFEVKPPISSSREDVLLEFQPLSKEFPGFTMETASGEFHRGEVTGVLGPNATGKTTFVKMLAGEEVPEKGEVSLQVRVSYKPQYIKPDFGGTVFQALSRLVTPGEALFDNQIARPLNLKALYDRELSELSGGELQTVAIAVCLARDAEVYLLDEPSAYLDVEQRLAVAKMIRRVIEEREALGIVVDHDLLFIDYISDRCMVFRGEAGKYGKASPPMGMRPGMNLFLEDMDVTFRRDSETGRPRANKLGSRKDKEQKRRGEYYYQVS